MPLLQPSSCSGFELELPKLTSSSLNLLDEPSKRKVTLDCRSGAAVTLVRSNIFVHGGLTIPLNLSHVSCINIQKELIIYFSKEKNNASNFTKLDDWISSETFFLDLISRVWRRVEVNFDDTGDNAGETNNENEHTGGDHKINSSITGKEEDTLSPTFKERLYHSMCFAESSLYIFGGLVVSPQSGYELIATNELWKLNLQNKKWTLVSKDPQITRRFTHSMHTINHDNEEDTKLIIVGGLNNIDMPIHHIDIFNVTKNYWETESDTSKIIVNCESEEISLCKESNFSILFENNEAKIPTLAFYVPNPSKSPQPNTGEASSREHTSYDCSSSIVALPLMHDAQGMRMNSKSDHSDHLEVPHNLQFPTGDYFGYTIVIAGFYPSCETSNFKCFVYDTSSQQWTTLGITCDDSDINKHRFWKLLAWQSHHQTLLLGTKNDDYNLPSVQRFDFLLSFGLPMISIYNRTLTNANNQKIDLKTSSSDKKTPSRDSSIAAETLDPKESENQPFRQASYASTATSQFESYIRYIAPPSDMTSIRTVFPPYAMVLGKDTLEIFGSTLSDFEFITDEGDSIGVPIYLLRKRWGRYFDMMLSQGYARACAEYENTGQASEFIRFSPHSSQIVNPSKNSGTLSRASFETFANRGNQQQQEDMEGPRSYSLNLDPHQAEIVSGEHVGSNSSFHENDEEDPVSPPSRSQIEHIKQLRAERNLPKQVAISTTSSSGGMIFRVPFQENASAAMSDTVLSKKEEHEDKRRSSSVATAALDHLKLSSHADRWRRASHPNPSISRPDDGRNHYTTSRLLSSSVQNSRRTSSIASHSSSISYVSSSSDRMGNSMYPGSGNGSSVGSSFLGVLNVALPPQEPIPSDTLPPPPAISSSASKRNSFAEFVYSHSSKSSPFSSRRPSHDRRSSSSDLRRPSDQYPPSLDRQMMDGSQVLDSPSDAVSFQQKSLLGKMSQKSADSWPNLSGKLHKNADTKRPSLDSNTDSTDSANSIEWEPLLTPRTLYMPWPTATVRAFAEFFFTGQVNGRWMLAPVVLNLLLMSKIYEIPLLYNLIIEVLCSIIGRKEDSLCVICDSLTDALRNKVLRLSNDDHELMESYLQKNETYNELLKLRKSLETIDDGYFDFDLIKKVSRAFSASSNSDSAPDKSSIAGGTQRTSSIIPTVFAGGPRDSHNSVGSIGGYPPSFRQPHATPQRVNNKSSLSKEISSATPGNKAGLSDLAGLEELEPDEKITAQDKGDKQIESRFEASDDEQSHYSTSDSSSDETEEEYEDALHETPSRSSVDLRGTIIDARGNTGSDLADGEYHEEFEKNIDELNNESQKPKSEVGSGSSLSDSDELNSDIGLLSLNKMRRKIAGQDDLDESIDPLFKVAFDSNATEAKNATSRSSRDDTAHYGSTAPTLENLASPNALPPVEYVIKSIYRTAALINYPRLMIRCLDCIEISKRLRSLKLKAILELNEIEEDLKKPGTISHELLKRKILEKQKSDSALSKSMSTRPNPATKVSAPDMDTVSRDSSTSCTQQTIIDYLTDKDSDIKNVKSASLGISHSPVGPHKKSIKNKFFGDSPINTMNTPLLMNPAFMPPPPSSARGKKSNASPNSGTFSFFGKKK